jgi:Flp pilus assembly protein TadG
MSYAAKTVAKKSLKRFMRKEDGNIATFSVLLFALMVMCGGLAVDLMRYEHTRTALQQTLDRCTLAAAQLKQTLDRTAVCRDYAAKAGLDIPLANVTVTSGTNFSEVRVQAMLEQPTIFAGMLGIPKWDVPARSSAMQAITNVEIAMVLDVSRSMILPETKLAGVKTAAKDFVATVLANDTENRTSIAIVPYNGQVNLGTILAEKYTITHLHGMSSNVNCVDLPASVYNTNTLSRTLGMPQTSFVDAYSGTNAPNNMWASLTSSSSALPNVLNRWCPSQPTNIIRLPNNAIPALQAQIDGLVGIGATSINAGMKWGMAMLDPENRPMFNSLRTAGHIPPAMVNRPYDYTAANDPTPDSMKIIVLMTDGENFPESRVQDDYRTGLSPIYRSSDGVWSIHYSATSIHTRPAIAGTDRYFWPSQCSASSTTPQSNVPSSCDAWRATPAGVAPHVQMTWPQVYENTRLSYVAWQFYARALGTSDATRQQIYGEQLNRMRVITPAANMNDQLQAVCDDAAERKIVVYGIAFEAPDNGEAQIKDCATSTTHYYEASTLNVSTAFKSIAARISQLRLTQ